MATFTFSGYMGAGPAWADLSTNRIVFSSSLTDLATAITVASFQDGTHAGDGTPGTDQCGANHMNNVKYVDDTHFSLNGAASAVLNDTNLADTDCTMQIHFNHGSAVAVSNARLYCYDNSTTTQYAADLDVYAFERGAGASSWTKINDASGVTGGDNSGERLDLQNSASATDHYWYVALSASPEAVGAKSNFAFGVALTYS
jgi:hypothetical protein